MRRANYRLKSKNVFRNLWHAVGNSRPHRVFPCMNEGLDIEYFVAPTTRELFQNVPRIPTFSIWTARGLFRIKFHLRRTVTESRH